MIEVPFSDQTAVTDEDFLRDIRLPGAAGRRLAAALAAGDLAGARAAAAGHFRTRRSPRWPFYMHGTPWPEIDGRGSVMRAARGLLAGRFRNSWKPFGVADLGLAGGRVDWERAPGALGGSLTRNVFVPELTTAFCLTGEPRYARRAVELIRGFLAAYPFRLDPRFFDDHDMHFGGPCNSTGCIGLRAFRWIDLLYCGAAQAPGIMSDDDVLIVVRQIWFYALQYRRFGDDAMRRDNHHLFDHGQYPFVLGTVFPEFSFSRALVAAGLRTFRHHARSNILADGCYAEHSTKYQYHILFYYLHSQAVADAAGVRLLPARERRRLGVWVEFIARMAKPDGVLAEFGDEYGGSLEHLFDPLAGPVMTPKLAGIARALGYRAGSFIVESAASVARKMRQWRPGTAPMIGVGAHYGGRTPAGSPRPAAPPEPPSARYPNGGFSVFRDRWAADSDFLAVAHYTDSMPHGHTHWDMMSFVLHSGGRTLVGDPATELYSGAKRPRPSGPPQEARGYLYAAGSHNCLIMDDDTLKALAAMGNFCFWGGYPPRHGLGIFEAGGPFEVAETWHDAYAPTRHRRFVVHARGLGFVLVDVLGRAELDLRPRGYAQRLHLERGVSFKPRRPRPGAAVRLAAGDASCLVIPGAAAEATWRSWRDRWLAESAATGTEIPGPRVLELTRRIRGPAVFSTFLVTRPARDLGAAPVPRGLAAERAPQCAWQPAGATADEIDLGNHGRLIVASCPYGRPVASDSISSDGELALAHVDAGGRLRSWCLARGSRLVVDGRRVVSGRRMEWRSS